MSVAIHIKNAVKRYGSATILPNLSVDIHNGELFTLLGPSGCGKTTLLRMIAGFNSIEGGVFFFDDRLINELDPGKRNIGMVFQNYAIFPHLSVRRNVAFGLKNRRLPKETIRRGEINRAGLEKKVLTFKHAACILSLSFIEKCCDSERVPVKAFQRAVGRCETAGTGREYTPEQSTQRLLPSRLERVRPLTR